MLFNLNQMEKQLPMNKVMKHNNIIIMSLAGLLSFPAIVYSAELQTVKQRASYAIGVNFANTFKAQDIALDADGVAAGVKDALTKDKNTLTADEMKQALAAYRVQILKEKEVIAKQQSKKNQQLGDTFLAENKTKEGVVTLKSGLQYKVIKSGAGKVKPTLGDKVTTHYRGTLIDGTEFDSSFSRKKPATFPVKGVIKGWTEALQLMHTGDKWQLFIPANLAYGKQSPNKIIQPNSTLVFDIELLKIN
jgi:FKBP-type peptidyl-prolyl cis-trans isomerase FklB